MSEGVPPLVESSAVSTEVEHSPGILCRNAGKAAACLALSSGALIGGVVGAKTFGVTTGEVCSVTVEVKQTPLTLDVGSPSVEARVIPEFDLEIPRAHANPLVKTDLEVTGVDRTKAELIRKKLDTGTKADLKELEQTCRNEATDLIEKSGWEAFVWGGLGAVAGSVFTYGAIEVGWAVIEAVRPSARLNKHRTVGLGMLALCTVAPVIPAGGSMIWAGKTVDEEAIQNPQYKGFLKDIEDLVDTSKISLKGYQEKSGELTKWIEQIMQLRDRLTEGTPEDDYLKILIVSDIHSRPCAYQRIELLNDTFDIDFDINNGDEVEWSENEMGLLLPQKGCGKIMGPGDISRPIFQVKGNHDPTSLMKSLDALSNVTVLDGEVVSIPYTWKGKEQTIRLLGVPDRRYEADDVLQGKDEPKSNLLGLLTNGEIDAIKEGNYDILVNHDPELFGELDEAELLPSGLTLLSAGHTHKAKVDQESFDSPLLVTGTSGGGGLRTYQNEGQPSAYSVVSIDPETKKVARIELISVTNDGVVTIRNVNVGSESD